MSDFEPYAPRPVTALGIWTHDGWRMKRYGIAYGRAAARKELVEAAHAAAREVLPAPPTTETRYGVGFLGAHDGRGANFVFVDWWENETELRHHVFFSPTDDPAALRPATRADPIACVWDLSVVGHERAAWIRHVLVGAAGDFDGYLADALDGTV
jgi:hypothetical protein